MMADFDAETLLSIQKALKDGRFHEAESIVRSAGYYNRPEFAPIVKTLSNRREIAIRDAVAIASGAIEKDLKLLGEAAARLADGKAAPGDNAKLMGTIYAVEDKITEYRSNLADAQEFLGSKYAQFSDTPAFFSELESNKVEIALIGALLVQLQEVQELLMGISNASKPGAPPLAAHLEALAECAPRVAVSLKNHSAKSAVAKSAMGQGDTVRLLSDFFGFIEQKLAERDKSDARYKQIIEKKEELLGKKDAEARQKSWEIKKKEEELARLRAELESKDAEIVRVRERADVEIQRVRKATQEQMARPNAGMKVTKIRTMQKSAPRMLVPEGRSPDSVRQAASSRATGQAGQGGYGRPAPFDAPGRAFRPSAEGNAGRGEFSGGRAPPVGDVEPSADPELWKELNGEAAELCKGGMHREAFIIAKEALEMAEEMFGAVHPNVAASAKILAEAQYNLGNYDDAEGAYRRVVSISEKELGEYHPDVMDALSSLSELYMIQGRYADAVPLLERLIDVMERNLGYAHPRMFDAMGDMVVAYRAAGNDDEARETERRLAILRENARKGN